MRLTVAAVMLLAACGVATADDGRGPIEPVSGSRLKVRHWTGADGSRLPVGLYDAELGVDCAPRMAADGKVRCLPVGLVETSEIYRLAEAYSDLEAGTPAWSSDPSTGGPWWPMVGDPIPSEFACYFAPTPRLVMDGSDICGHLVYEVIDIEEAYIDGDLQPVEGMRTIGPEVPPTRFVEMTSRVQ